MCGHWWTLALELPVFVPGRLLLLRWIVDLGLQVGHSVGQVLEKLGLGPGLDELLHSWIHLSLLLCTAGTASS
jgi:hypothetical protein